MDAVVLMALFGFYARATASTESVEPDLMGPPVVIAALPRATRRAICAALFAGAAWTIFLAAHPFANSLVRVGRAYHINQFLLVQWLAPLASEMPEFIVAGLFAWRRAPAMGLGALISSKVNQWTLLVGLLPICFGIAARQVIPLPLDDQQTAEVLLTSAQSLFAVAVLLNFSVTVTEAAGLLFLFMTQAIAQLMIHVTLPNTPVVHADFDESGQTGPNNQLVYQKGAWTLHMLRGQIGTDAFWRGIRLYYQAHMNGLASGADLEAAMEQASGQDLAWFFRQWLTRPGEPQIEGSWRYDAAAKKVVATIRQTQTMDPFRFSLDIGVVSSPGAAPRVQPFQITGRETTIAIAADTEPASVVLDPNVWLLARWGTFGTE
jgi:hypothetical protein